MEPELGELAWNLRAAMRERGMSQAELSRASGLTPAAVSRYANGLRDPTATSLARIADALGVEPAALVPARRPATAGELGAAVDMVRAHARELSDAQAETLVLALLRARRKGTK